MEFTVNLNVNVRFSDLTVGTTTSGVSAALAECFNTIFAAYSGAKVGRTSASCSYTGDCCKTGCEKEQKEARTTEETSTVAEKEQKEADSGTETSSIGNIMKTCAKLIEAGKREQIMAILKELNSPPVPLADLPPEQLKIFAEKLKQLEG